MQAVPQLDDEATDESRQLWGRPEVKQLGVDRHLLSKRLAASALPLTQVSLLSRLWLGHSSTSSCSIWGLGSTLL